jgi:hypothetical protein
VSSRAKSSVSALAERKIASARPRKYGLLLRAEEEMLLYGQALVRFVCGQAAPVGRTSPELLAKYGLSPDGRKLAGPVADAATSIAA